MRAPPGPGRPQAAGRPASLSGRFDVVVVGGGNAALVAAIEARLQGASVLVLERAREDDRGGNTRHTRNIRCAHAGSDAYSSGPYSYEELWGDLCAVGSGPTDERLASLTVAASAELPAWMAARGVRWQAPLAGTLQLGRTNKFFLGGGKALLNRYYRTAAEIGVAVAYGAEVLDLLLEGGRCEALSVLGEDGAAHELATASVVCACGGFEANLEWLGRYWGDAAANFHVRGPRYNDGRVLAALYAAGAKSAGEERGFHAVAVDARSPQFNGGIATRIDAVPLGVVVNRAGRRFYDEGEDLWPKRYATWGRLLAEQEGQIGYCLWDSKVAGRFLPPLYPPVRAESVAELAAALSVDAEATAATVEAFNQAVPENAPRFDPSCLDGRRTEGVSPAKSNWAQRLDTPPYFAVPLRPGITFTYRGLAVDDSARVLRADGSPLANLFAAGEIMSGNILSTGYLAGFGMTIGTAWGIIAGASAAAAAAASRERRCGDTSVSAGRLQRPSPR